MEIIIQIKITLEIALKTVFLPLISNNILEYLFLNNNYNKM